MIWKFTLQKDGAGLTVMQQEYIKRVIEDYDFKNFQSLKSIELVDVDKRSFSVSVEATKNDWTQHLSRLLQNNANLFEHKEKDRQLFITECK